MEQIREYTLSVFTEDKIGLMSRVVAVFTRRHINIMSINASESSLKGIHRLSIVVHVDADMIEKLARQLEKQVDVIKVFYYQTDEIVYQELALYKVPTEIFMGSNRVEDLIRRYNARILSIEPAYIVIEKTGHKEETTALLRELENIGIYEFVRSGRIAITKQMEPLNQYLKTLEWAELN